MTLDEYRKIAAKFKVTGSDYILDFFINCSGKSGSMTLTESFKALNKRAMHIHGNKALRHHMGPIKYKVNDIIDFCSFHKKVYVIDVYRNPIERKISAIFQGFNPVSTIAKIQACSNDELIKYVNDNFLQTDEYNSFEEWSINMYDYPFDHDTGYKVVTKDNITYILLKFDRINDWENQINSILNTMDFKLVNKNLTKDKIIYPQYEFIKKNWAIPPEFVQYIHTNDRWKRVMQYFMTEDEYINYFKKYKD